MISKVSEITIEEVAEYIKVDDYVRSELETYLNIAKTFISSYTGIPIEGEDESLDDFADFVIVALILCQDMYDNRTLYVDKSNLNKVVQIILDMHTRVFL